MPKRYQDKAQWDAIRRRVLEEGASRRQVARETGICLTTIAKMLRHTNPPPPVKGVAPRRKLGPFIETIERMVGVERPRNERKDPNVRAIFEAIRDEGYCVTQKTVGAYTTALNRRKYSKWGYIYDTIVSLDRVRAIKYLYFLSIADKPEILTSRADDLARASKLITEVQWDLNRRDAKRMAAREWMHDLAQGKISLSELRTEIGDIPDLAYLFKQARDGTLVHRKKL